MSETCDARADSPAKFGFAPAGYVVRRPDGSYLEEMRFLRPTAGVTLTHDECRAAVFETKKDANWAAARIGGEVAERFVSREEVLVRWGVWES